MAPLERQRELAVLAEAMAGAARGSGSVVLIEGPAGIGKSAVLDATRREAPIGLRQLAARGGPLERDFAFGAVRQLLEVATRTVELPDAAAAVLGAPSSDPAAGAGEGSFAALHGLFWTVLDLASEQPLLLAIDDLQWADRPSLRFFAYLAKRIEELPLVVVATVRTGEPDADQDLLDAIAEPPTQRLLPAPLSAAGVAAVIEERLGAAPDEAFTDACHAATLGNPLLLRELASALQADGVQPLAKAAGTVREIGTRAVTATVERRLAKLGDDAVATARTVAVLGDGSSVADVAAFAGLPESRVAAATGPLARAEILRAEPPLAFVHPLVADAVSATLGPGEREQAHARAAEFLRDSGAPGEQIAGHLVRAAPGAESWIVDALLAAAATAMRRGAPDSAARYLRRALDEPPPADRRAELLLQLGLAETLSSGADAVEHLEGALVALVDPARRALAAATLGRVLLFTERPRAAADVVLRVADELGDEHADLRDQLLGFAATTGWFDERASSVGEDTRLQRERVPGPDAGAGPRMIAASAAFAWANEPGPRAACVELAEAAVAGNWLLDADPGFLFLPPVMTLGLAEQASAIEHLDRAMTHAHRHGSLLAIAGVRLWSSAVRLWRSELADSEQLARQAYDELRLWGFGVNGLNVAFLIMALVRRGKLAEARVVLDGASSPLAQAEGQRLLLEAELELLIAERADEAALAVAARLQREFSHVGNPVWATWRSRRAPLRFREGDQAGALADLDAELQLAEQWGAPGPIGRVLRIRGELLDNASEIERAVDILRGSTARLELAEALRAHGRTIRLDRRPIESREPLREALSVAATCGADALAKEIRSELGAAGARPRTDALDGIESLTPSERRVADLAAGGLTNRDIAQQLFVTPKTVEVHLSAVYRKLGLASRRELPAAVAAADDTP